MEIIHSKISTKGQVTLPKQFREKLKLIAGEDVDILLTEDGILIRPKTLTLRKLRGILQGKLDLEKAREFIQAERKKWS